VFVQHLSTLEFLSYFAFAVVALIALAALVPGRRAPLRHVPFAPAQIAAHDRRLPKYFLAGGAFLVLGAVHMVAKNLPWVAEWLARAGYAGHVVRDLSNTHVMIVGGGTLIATGICWYALPRIVARPLASDGLAQCAFWFTALGLLVFYVALVANGIVMARHVVHGMSYPAAKASMGKWYKVPVGMGAGVMGVGYWCFAANVGLTAFHARLLRVPKPAGHLWKFLVTGAAALTVGTVQGVVQVQPAHATWLYRAGHAGEWIDPISHAHMNLVTGLTMLAAGGLFFLAPQLGGRAPSRRDADRCFWALLAGSLAFYGAALFLGLHEGHLVVAGGMTPEQAEEATPLHPYLIMGAGVAMLAAFWLLLHTVLRSLPPAGRPARAFVFAGCAALAVGTLQGPVQAFPAVHELLDRGGGAGAVIVNLHAQLNMLGGLMLVLLGMAVPLLGSLTGIQPGRWERTVPRAVLGGMAVYYTAGIAFAAVEARAVAGGQGFGPAVADVEPWAAVVLVPAALAVLVGFGAYARGAWRMSAAYRASGRRALAAAPGAFSGRIPRRVRRRRPLSVAAWDLPLGVLGFPGFGWLFAGFPLAGTVLLILGPALAWAAIPVAFSPFGNGPLRALGWRSELVWLPASALLSAGLLYRAHRRRLARIDGGGGATGGIRRRPGVPRARIAAGVGAIALVLVSLPFVPALTGIGTRPVRYAYQDRLTRDITGPFMVTPGGRVKLFAWGDPQSRYPSDALRVHAAQLRSFLVRAAAVDRPAAYRLYDLGAGRAVPLGVRQRSATSLTLAPLRPPAPGRYLFAASHEGMFGGRDFVYLTVVPPGARATPIADRGRVGAPAVADALLPVAAALLAALFALRLLLSFRRRPAGEKLLWGAGFALFAIATGCEAVAEGRGWSPALFRAYYATGGVLTVAYLGAGSAWLLLPRRGRDALVGALGVATLGAVLSVAVASVHRAGLAAASAGQPPPDGVLTGHAFLWAVALNSLGTLALVGGALYSAARRRRVRSSLWIAAGALVLAGSTGLSRTGHASFMYAGELVGIALMFTGFTLPPQRPRAPGRAPVATRPSEAAVAP
jgi:cytochrome c oxidase cbb3-type subunit 1